MDLSALFTTALSTADSVSLAGLFLDFIGFFILLREVFIAQDSEIAATLYEEFRATVSSELTLVAALLRRGHAEDLPPSLPAPQDFTDIEAYLQKKEQHPHYVYARRCMDRPRYAALREDMRRYAEYARRLPEYGLPQIIKHPDLFKYMNESAVISGAYHSVFAAIRRRRTLLYLGSVFILLGFFLQSLAVFLQD